MDMDMGNDHLRENYARVDRRDPVLGLHAYAVWRRRYYEVHVPKIGEPFRLAHVRTLQRWLEEFPRNTLFMVHLDSQDYAVGYRLAHMVGFRRSYVEGMNGRAAWAKRV